MKKCSHCGAALPDEAMTCPECDAVVAVGGKKQHKAAKIGGIAAVIVVIAVVIAIAVGPFGKSGKSAEYTGERPVVYGSFDDTVYQNDFFGFQMTLPEGWRFESYDEMVGEEKENYHYTTTGVPYEQGKDWIYYYDAVMTDDDTYSRIMITEFLKDDDFPDAASVLDYYADTKKTDGAVVGRTKEYYTTKAGGSEFLTCNVQYDLISYKVHSGFFVAEKDGWYVLINVVLTSLDGGTPAEYIEQLQPLQ